MAKLLFMQDAKGGKEEKEEKHDKGAAAAKGKKEKEEKGGAKKGTHKYESAMLLLYAMLAYVFVDPVMHSFIWASFWENLCLFCCLLTSKVQIRLCICIVWSAAL